MNTETQTMHIHKKTYTKPCLVNYGEVSSLTQSGSKPGEENQGNTQGSMT